MYIPKIDIIILTIFIVFYNIITPLGFYVAGTSTEKINGFMAYMIVALIIAFTLRFFWRLACRIFGEFKWKK